MSSLTSDGNVTSFQKKGRSKVPYIEGTRQSVQNAQILASSGMPSLDHVLGNGLPVGTILLIEEDVYGTFSKVMMKYFLAEGVACNHPLFLASRDIVPKSLIEELPLPVREDTLDGLPNMDASDPMTIAWRYQNMRQVQSTPVSSSVTQLGHNFDLTRTIPIEELEHCDISFWSGPEKDENSIGAFSNPNYGYLLSKIQRQIIKGQFRVKDEPSKHNVLRLALHSLGSPMWVDPAFNQSIDAGTKKDLPKFLFFLRSLLRDAYAMAIVTIPCHLFEDSSIQGLCEYQSDMALELESFVGSAYETNSAFKEYHGLLHVHKLGPVNTLATHVPESLDLAFKLRRKKFVIEKLHLPPELQESAQREQDDVTSSRTPTMSCVSNASSKLDF